MEERKLDINSIIGFVLIFAILLYMLWQNQPTPEELEAQEKAKQEQVQAEEKAKADEQTAVKTVDDFSVASTTDSLQLIQLNNKLGAFAYSASLPSAVSNETLVENDVLALNFSNKGGYLSEVKLKQFVNYDSVPIYLIKDNNAALNINFGTTDSRILNTKDLYFQPSVSNNGDNTVVSMKLKVSETKFLEYRYELKKDDYMMNFTIRSQGLSNVINSSQNINLSWDLKGYRHDKSVQYENRYTRLTYAHEGNKVSKLAQMSDDEEDEVDVSWMSYRQHFFSSILLADTPFKNVNLTSKDLVEDEEIDLSLIHI